MKINLTNSFLVTILLAGFTCVLYPMSKPLSIVSKSGIGLNAIREIYFEAEEELIEDIDYKGEQQVLFEGAVNGYEVEIITELESYYSKTSQTQYRPWTRIYLTIKHNEKNYQDSFSIRGNSIGGYQVESIDHKLVVFIWIINEGSGSYGDFYTIVYDDRFSSYIVEPYSSLNEDLRKSYMGHDSYEFKGDKISRSFPIYKNDDANCCPSGGKALIQYRYKDQGIVQEHITFLKNK